MRVFSAAKAVKCGPAGVVENQCILVGTFLTNLPYHCLRFVELYMSTNN